MRGIRSASPANPKATFIAHKNAGIEPHTLEGVVSESVADNADASGRHSISSEVIPSFCACPESATTIASICAEVMLDVRGSESSIARIVACNSVSAVACAATKNGTAMESAHKSARKVT